MRVYYIVFTSHHHALRSIRPTFLFMICFDAAVLSCPALLWQMVSRLTIWGHDSIRSSN